MNAPALVCMYEYTLLVMLYLRATILMQQVVTNSGLVI